MKIEDTLILGIVQGVTEFLPISSSAHLIILRDFFRIEGGDLTYDVMLHFATLLATLTLYGRNFTKLVFQGMKNLGNKTFFTSALFFILISSIPAAIGGFIFRDFIEENLRTPSVCAFMLITVSILMFIAERKKSGERDMSWITALAIGIGQMISLVPGTSRSGITITTALLLGIRRDVAVDFSFLMSFPVIFGAFLYELRHINLETCFSPVYFMGMVASTISGIASLKFLISYLRGHTLEIFALYRILVAFLVLLSPYK